MSPPTGFRLSPQQARLWSFLATGPAEAYRARCVLLLDGDLDARALERALQDVLSRHEILRTAYLPLPGTTSAVQVPGPVPPAVLDRLDWSGASGEEQAARLDALLEGRLAAPTPAAAPTFHLAALGPRRHVLTAQLPALSADRQSLANLARELGQAYEAQFQPGSPLKEPAAQYADVAEVFNQLIESGDTDEGRRYWQAQDVPELTGAALAPSRPRTGERDFQPRCAQRPLPEALTAGIEAAAGRLGVPAATFVLACWQVLLSRLSGRPGWAVAVRYDGRAYEGLGEAIGLFERYLPVRCTVPEGGRFTELLREVARATHEAVEWQDYFDVTRGLRTSGEEGTPSWFPFAFEEFAWPEPLCAGGLSLAATRLEAWTDRFDLKLACVRRGGGLELELHHDAHRHTPAEIARLVECLQRLLAGAAAAPERAMDELPLVGEEEERRLDGFNRTGRPYDTDGCIHERFDEQARRTPEAPAVVFGDERLTFAGLAERANRLAWYLRARGVGPEVRVGLLLDRSVEQIVALLGILKAGGAFVPLDPMYPRERLAHILQQGQAELIVTRAALLPMLPGGIARPVCLDAEVGELARAPASAPPNGAGPDNLAYILFTSGSTGRPKGAMIPHRSVLNLAAALREQVYQGRGPGLRVSVNAPLVFDASVKQWAQLLHGDALHLIPEEARPDAARLRDLVRRQGIDVLDCTPSILVPMLAHGLGQDPDFSPALVLVGGEALDARTWEELAHRARTRFVNVYGPTECTVDATACPIPAAAEPSIGWPIPNARVHLLDRHLCRVPTGAPGELFIGGAGVCRGYAGQPALTAERFVPDPFGPPGARLYRTGDLGRQRDDGRIEFLGRTDHQVKLQGFRFELGEIEARLTSHPEVSEAVAVVRELSPGERHLVAYFVPKAGGGPDAGARGRELATSLRAFLREALPEYMIPRALVPLARLPLNHNGKLDRGALPAPRPALEDEAPYEGPATPLEETIARIWRQALGTDKIGLHANFFDLGGHSLLMVQVHEKLSAALGRRLSMVELFQHPTIAALARYLGQAAGPQGGAPGSRESLDERAHKQRQFMQQQAQLHKAGRGKR